MKLGAESRNKTIAAGALMVLAIFLLWRSFSGPGVQSPPPAAAQTGPAVNPATPAAPARRDRRRGNQAAGPTVAVNPLDPRLRLDLLKSSQDVAYSGSGRNIFLAQAEAEIPKPVENPVRKANNTPPPPPQPQGPPPPAPPPFKAFGMATGPGMRKVMLVQGDEVFVVKEGDVVDRQYKIVKINPNSIDVEDLLNNNHLTNIPLITG